MWFLPSGAFARMRVRLCSRQWRHHLGAAALLLAVVGLVLPSPYVIQGAGPTQDVLGTMNGSPVIEISGASEHKDDGRLLMVTVNARGVPGHPILNVESLLAWVNPQQVVLPTEAVFPVGQSAEEYRQESDGQMRESESTSQTAALDYAKHLGIDVNGVEVKVSVDEIGGPSAGMMYALGIIDMLSEEDLTGGKTIAGTGTIDKNGKVGAIGGVRLKMLGAQRDGATWFLAPGSNCNEVVGHVPDELRDVKVNTLDEAYQALRAIGQGEGDSLPRCDATG